MAEIRTPSSSVQGVAILVFLGGVYDVGLGALLLLQVGAPSPDVPAGIILGSGVASIVLGALCGAAAVGFWRLRKWAWTTVAALLWIDVCLRTLALLLGGVSVVDIVALCFFVGLLFLVYRVRPSFAPGDEHLPLHCPRCGYGHTPDANHCPQCGADLLHCPHCGHTHTPLAEYCAWCQKPLLPPTILPSEKKEQASIDGPYDKGASTPA